jgi:hypothetical protein
MTATNLYRHFDVSGNLLYVGISLSAVGRLAQHMGGSEWKYQIARVEIKTLESRDTALEAEAIAIRTEFPAWNKISRIRTGIPRFREFSYREGMISTTLARSSLFAVRDKREQRKKLENVEIVSLDSVDLRYTGEELRQDDHDVFALDAGLSEIEALRTLNWGISSEDYGRLRACRERIEYASISEHPLADWRVTPPVGELIPSNTVSSRVATLFTLYAIFLSDPQQNKNSSEADNSHYVKSQSAEGILPAAIFLPSILPVQKNHGVLFFARRFIPVRNTMTTSIRHFEIIRHMLGMTGTQQQSWGTRNCFATYADGKDYEDLRTMESRGLVKLGTISAGGMHYFHVTENGFTAVGMRRTANGSPIPPEEEEEEMA